MEDGRPRFLARPYIRRPVQHTAEILSHAFSFPKIWPRKLTLIQKFNNIFKAITQGEDRDFAAIGAPGVVIPRLALEL